jgi:hypothetical protein
MGFGGSVKNESNLFLLRSCLHTTREIYFGKYGSDLKTRLVWFLNTLNQYFSITGTCPGNATKKKVISRTREILKTKD